jgi:hypothetical protein
MTDTTANLGLPVIAAAQAQKHVTHNEALRLIDTLVQLAVLDRDLATPPGTPNEGERWIVGPSPTGDWAGHAGEIAAWQEGAWQLSLPRPGWLAFVIDEGKLVIWNGSAWSEVSSTVTALQNLALLGVGTTADATNPFSAKLNNALWVARTVAEGGDGDLRYKMSKEGAGDVLSLLMQTNFSGRAEFGLIGDDDLTIKVSPDGSAWRTALVADRATGAVSLPNTLHAARGLILPQTRALIAAMANEPRRVRTLLIDDLITTLVDAGVWAKLDILYVLAAHDSQAALINWIDPAGVAGTAVNGPTFTADRGFAGDGATSYIDSGIRLDTLGGNYTQDSACMFVWSLTDAADDDYYDIGTGTQARLNARRTTGSMLTRANDGTNSAVAVADSLGLSMWSRGASGSYDRYRNATSLGAASVASIGLDNTNLDVLRGGPGQYSARQIAVAGVGGYLDASEQGALHGALSDYLTDVGA